MTMANAKYKAVHYINQFYGQIGGEEKADVRFTVKEGPFGPGMLLQKELGDDVAIVATIICGDNYFASNLKEASEELLKLVAPYAPDIFFAGPAFGAGRYGIASGQACKSAGEAFKIPTVGGMHEENPGVELYRPHAYIAKTHNSAAKMGEAVAKMADIGKKLLKNTHGHVFVGGFGIGTPEEEGYFPQMMIRNVFVEKTAAKRSVDMLLAKIAGKPFKTEMPYAEFEKIDPPKPIKDLSKCRIAVVSDGGLVDKTNTAKLKTRGCNVWGKYTLDEFFAADKKSEDFYVSHTGYFGDHVIADRNRMIPYDVLTEMKKEEKIGGIHPNFYTTCGNSTVAKWCARMGDEIVEELMRDKVDAVILTST